MIFIFKKLCTMCRIKVDFMDVIIAVDIFEKKLEQRVPALKLKKGEKNFIFYISKNE